MKGTTLLSLMVGLSVSTLHHPLQSLLTIIVQWSSSVMVSLGELDSLYTETALTISKAVPTNHTSGLYWLN